MLSLNMTDDEPLCIIIPVSVRFSKRPSSCCVFSPADGPKNVVISGPDSLEVGITASFSCSAECTPSCSFTWNLYGKTMTGGTVDITVNRYISTEFISCQAENTFTKEMVTVNETLSVSGRLLVGGLNTL